ncbi:phosphoglycerate mutase (2,3-diphosphoglycerate-independent) [Snodgrassella alvi]|uniref:2,3-bisphosphoglycerate-independent phosphoglycerate mutase n=1 Tax=Snodgrassella alvi TaxID=1196083 RepID=UPI0009FDE9E2|nr:2,3-bisphosphoglycerate-independent phosphoglycerate mutase [Snodgrassella alvi]ORE99988.1 phosphoglycerate mutase (2,3-diphosphoglycerate-independent) [Snodgrassella alvi]ORF06764.1 phosphoglycerate mutase (2,3-diphosphoglycerate-independent) [Snodgrassella alvi]ORF10081.1 phosphoglycerate mutase (2,3-diphosphoglycerate-independent) [Snodgrassella alvi]ORF11346.1 phosphoglycerate mutase (2,3-diphosphoglycerate-independent) [Snodgrassella alvi]ORF17571.1 phosphoglycerate mutase (2,3-diphosp
MSLIKPVVLLILDGFGHRAEGNDNAILLAHTPHLDNYRQQYAYGTIDASERMVGLPVGQFGNSEVGHLNIGAGRVVPQDITRIDMAIEDHTLEQNPVLQQAWNNPNHTVHLLGLFSDGGVHSHIEHFFAVIDAALAAGMQKIVVHPFLDGRDTPPQSARPYLQRLQQYMQQHSQILCGAIVGRFFAMDRDNRWDRVEAAYNALFGDAPYQADSPVAALDAAYTRGEQDEFVKPTIVSPQAKLLDGDAILFLNFRADRARELTQALTFADFDGFKRKYRVQPGYFATITAYGTQFSNPVMFEKQSVNNGLGEFLAGQGLRQLRIAETEKYPHVTYFFSGGREEPYIGEERIMIPSPKVTTYDLQPEMSAVGITEQIIDSLKHHRHDVIICNFANGDMVGHTGSLDAAIKAVETLDSCVAQVVETTLSVGGEVIITADHGNCEHMYDEKNQQPHTQHTVEPVPFIYIGRKATIRSGGALKDVAPSLLTALGLTPPAEMTGQNLIEFTDK